MSFSKQQILEVAQKIGKNKMNGVKLLKTYSDDYFTQNKDIIKKGCILDTETTGLDFLTDEIIELAVIPFLYNSKTFEIVKILPSYQSFNEIDDLTKITPEITDITNITQDDVKGHHIDWLEVTDLCDECEFIIAHNAEFDKLMCSKYTKFNSLTEWFCSNREVDWYSKGLTNPKQEVLCVSLDFYKQGRSFDFDAHRAINDVEALLQLIINAEVLEEILEPLVELQAYGFVSKRFYKLFWSKNRFYIRNSWENGKKITYTSTTVKKSKVDEIKLKAQKSIATEMGIDLDIVTDPNHQKCPVKWVEKEASKKY